MCFDDHYTDSQVPSEPGKLKVCEKIDAKTKDVIEILVNGKHLDHLRKTESTFEMWTDVMNVLLRKNLSKDWKVPSRFCIDTKWDG